MELMQEPLIQTLKEFVAFITFTTKCGPDVPYESEIREPSLE